MSSWMNPLTRLRILHLRIKTFALDSAIYGYYQICTKTTVIPAKIMAARINVHKQQELIVVP